MVGWIALKDRVVIRVILESPFAGVNERSTQRNVAYAKKCMLDSLNRGEAPIASHLLYPQVLDDHNPTERQWGIDAGLAWRVVAEKAVFYTDGGWSRGMLAAKELYDKEGIPYEERAIL